MNLILVLVSPVLALVGYVVIRLIYFIVNYLLHKGAFDKMPRIQDRPFLAFSGFVPDFSVIFPKILHEAFPNGVPPLYYAGPGFSGAPTVVVHDPVTLRIVSDDNVFPKQPVSYDLLGTFLGNGLVTSKGAFWHQQRNLINPWFHAGKLKEMTEGMTKCGEAMVAKLKSKNGAPVDVVELVGQITQKVLVDSMFSGKLDPAWLHVTWQKANEALNNYMVAGLVLGYSFNSLKFWPWTRKIMAARGLINAKVQELIVEAQKYKGNQDGDFIEYLVANDCPAEQIFEESMTMLFAGHDTTKNSLSWLMYYLGENPAVVQKLQQEVDTELKGAAPTFNDISKLRHCRNALNETLRLRPPVGAVERIVVEDTVLCDTVIPKGTVLSMSFSGSLMDPKYWKDTYTFNPDRFDENLQYTNYFMPFSFGARNCIGQKFAMQEEVLLAAMVLQHFDIVRCKEDAVVAVYEGTLVPKGLRCKFIERKKL